MKRYVKVLVCLAVALSGCARVPRSLAPPRTAGAVPIPVGQDFLALQQSNFKEVFAGKYNSNVPTGSLDVTFGVDLMPVRNLLTKVNPPYHRVHILNTTCVRNQNCGNYEIVFGYTIQSLDTALKNHNEVLLNKFRMRVALYRGLSEEFPNTQFLLSPALEHDLSPAAWRVLANATLETWPGVQLVNSPDANINAETYKGAWIERHGAHPANDALINSFDGDEASDANIKAWLKRTRNISLRFIWSRVYNCRTNSSTFVDPRNRTACPDEGNFEELAHLADKRPPKPESSGTNCASIQPFKAPYIWKPMSEDTGAGNAWSNYPVVILPWQSGTTTVHAKNGTKIGQLDYFGPYTNPGYFRYYSRFGNGSGINGYGFEKRATKEAGSPWVMLRVGGNCTGYIVPGRRAGTYLY